MEEMNSKLSVKYEYKDPRRVKQQQEISISSGYNDGFDIHQIADFVLSVISLTGYSAQDVLFETIEMSNYANAITDDLNLLGYGTRAEEEE